MAGYTVYDTSTGAIIKTGISPEEFFEQQIDDPATQAIAPFQVQLDDKHEIVIVNGEPVARVKL